MNPPTFDRPNPDSFEWWVTPEKERDVKYGHFELYIIIKNPCEDGGVKERTCWVGFLLERKKGM